MNNKTKRQLRRAFVGLSVLMLIFSAIVYIGIPLGPYAPGFILYTPYIWVLVSVAFFAARTFIRERKMIWNVLGFFEPSGLTTMVDVPSEDITPTHIKYKTPDGEERRVKHHHGFAIPGEDGYDVVYLTPRHAVEALNPARLFRKYALKLTDEIKTQVMEHYEKMIALFPEAEALDPNRLTAEEMENDDPDRLNQELASTVSDIKRGFMDRLGLKQQWFQIFAGIAMGALAVTIIFMAAGVDFRGIVQH